MYAKRLRLRIEKIGKVIKKYCPKILLDEYLKETSETIIATMPIINIIYL